MSKMLEFIRLIGKLKSVRRTGWVNHGVNNPESVSDHMYRMGILAMLFTGNGSKLNKEHCIKIALVHDMAECIVGDITPSDGISKEEKHQKEKDAMEHLISLLDEDLGKEIFDLWKEYECQTSEEAKMVKDLDKLEMIIQAHEYEQDEARFGEMQEFFDSTKGKFHNAEVKECVEELYKERNKTLR